MRSVHRRTKIGEPSPDCTPRYYSRLALIFGGLIALSVAKPATAQGPFDDWREPVVVELELAGALNGERPRELRRRRIELGPRESFTVQVDPFDQRGRHFPTDRFQMGVELERECDGRVSLSETYSGDLEFTAGRSRGRCQVVLYVPGNLNLEHVLEFDVTGMGTGSYTRRQAEEVVERLYRAILQRGVDRGSRAAAGARDYLREISRGRHAEAIMNLIQSGEFETSLPSR